jgi:hypothetical protein
MRRVKLFGMTMAAMMALSAVPAFAADQTSFGVEAGANFTKGKLGGSNSDAANIDTKMGTGFLAGVFATIPVSPMIAIQPEAAYSQHKSKLSSSAFSFSETLNWNFIDIPVLVRINFMEMASPTWYAVVGPQVSIKLSAKGTDVVENGVARPDEEQKDSIKSTAWSVIGGIGAMFGQFGVEARYGYQFSDLNGSCDATGNNCLDTNLTVKGSQITVLGRYSIK